MKKISGTMICILSACVIVVFYLFFNLEYNLGKDDLDKDNASNIEMDLSKIEIANVENSLGQFDIKDMDTSSTDKICEYIEDIPEELLDLFLERKTNTSDNPYAQYIVSPNVQDEELVSQFYEIIVDNGKGYSINGIESLTQIDMIYKKYKLLPDYIGDNRYNLENLTEKR